LTSCELYTSGEGHLAEQNAGGKPKFQGTKLTNSLLGTFKVNELVRRNNLSTASTPSTHRGPIRKYASLAASGWLEKPQFAAATALYGDGDSVRKARIV